MENIVTYILNLKDNLSSTLTGANSHAQHLESTLGGVKSMATSIGTALGVAFGAYELIEYGKGALEAWEQVEQTTAKVEANMVSTGEKAGMTINQIKGYTDELSSKINATTSEVMDMASQMLTFPAITKDVFQSSMGLVADIAKQTGHGLSETAIMYGKALNDPTNGLQKMMRYGVMFTDEEKKKVIALQASGKLIESQKFMMDAIAHSGYAGVAEAMFNAEPMARFNKMMEKTKEKVGELIDKFIVSMVPALEKIARGFKAAFGWIEEHADLLNSLAWGIGAAGVAMAGSAVSAWVLAGGIGALVTTTTAWAAALWATGIPEIIIAITALVVIVKYAWNHFEGFRKTLFSVGNVIELVIQSIKNIGLAIYEMINGVANRDWAGMKAGFAKLNAVANDAGKSFSKAWNDGQEQGAKSYWRDNGEKAKTLIPEKIKGKAGTSGADGTPAVSPKTKAEGQKTINIHVAYNAPLIKDFSIHTVNMKEGLQELKDQISALLVGATHDTLMVADY